VNKLAAFLLSVVLGFLGCASCSGLQNPSSTGLLAEKLKAETVALVRQDDDGSWDRYCAGVWVSGSHILTAAHCVQRLGEDDAQQIIHAVSPELDNYSPVGQIAQWQAEKDSKMANVALVIAFDKKADLALLDSNLDVIHPVAYVGEFPKLADKVEIVGHPWGEPWIYSEGLVSAPHSSDKGYTQLIAPVQPGNSGGGMFDTHGQLIGIAHAYIKGSMICWFVDRDQIAKFLESN
jgi:V8-like Glu-specific endopeptidase